MHRDLPVLRAAHEARWGYPAWQWRYGHHQQDPPRASLWVFGDVYANQSVARIAQAVLGEGCWTGEQSPHHVVSSDISGRLLANLLSRRAHRQHRAARQPLAAVSFSVMNDETDDFFSRVSTESHHFATNIIISEPNTRAILTTPRFPADHSENFVFVFCRAHRDRDHDSEPGRCLICNIRELPKHSHHNVIYGTFAERFSRVPATSDVSVALGNAATSLWPGAIYKKNNDFLIKNDEFPMKGDEICI